MQRGIKFRRQVKIKSAPEKVNLPEKNEWPSFLQARHHLCRQVDLGFTKFLPAKGSRAPHPKDFNQQDSGPIEFTTGPEGGKGRSGLHQKSAKSKPLPQ